MAAISYKITINSNLNTNGLLSPPPNKLHSHLLPSNQKFCGHRILASPPLSLIRSNKSWHGLLRVSNLSQSSVSNSFDVVIVGAGIIGLTIARHLLLASDLSVALVDAAVPCSGATGAGQGYIWKAHKSPGTEKWELMMRSHQLWESLAKSIQLQGMDPLEVLGWKKTGSLLVSKTTDESAILKRRVEELSQEGLRAEFLSSNDLLSEEPELVLEKEGGAAFFPDDYQLDAHRTVAFIEKGNRHFAVEGRYAEFYHEPAIGLVRHGNSCEVGAIQTSKNTLHSKKAVVIAAGCWTGSLMHDLIKQPDIELDLPIKPRKGHLLVIENFKSFKLNHGIMEAGYTKHQSATLKATASDSGPVYNAQDLSVSMTATMDASGNLVLGSSRQLVGFNTEVDESVINHIWKRVGEFIPALRHESLEDLRQSREVRVGLRPYIPDGKPAIGLVPGFSNVFLAAGHEGEGLSLALGTAEMIADMVLGNPSIVDTAPFALLGRCFH
ncbi:glycine oxidase [Solanum tuberosum]|uniref:glycine oxidase n=1 Tax=Solanum tuberosum TaxID=4113 RepID=UPI0003D24D6B|nr:PREDICTED: glycine oxidase [Solanum tuberosum]XP_006345713.1 PREDICTED: glycine oxidase [Solanum tuberosum]XP_015163494.1 PREDICTED: glycine oxidase [Solanum tuberosum]